MPRIDPGYDQPKPKPKKKYVKPTTSPVGDANKAAGLKRAERFKRTPKYRAAVRAAYREGSLGSRRTQVERAQAKTGQAAYRKSLGLQPRSVEETAVLEAHRQRHKYYLKLARQRVGDRPQDRAADFARAESFTGVRHLPGGRIEFKNPKWPEILASIETPEEARNKAKTAALRSRRSSLGGPADYVSAIPVGLAGTAAALAEATYHDPVGVPVKTAKQAVLAVPAALGGAVEMARHPVKTTEAAAKDYFARVARESRPQKVKRIRKEGGFADLADLATAATGTGAATSAAARAALLSRVGERAAVRVSGGVVKSRGRGGLTKTVAGHVVDDLKARRLARDLAEAERGGKPMDAVRRQAAEANRTAGRTVEIVPRLSNSKLVRAVATARGKAIYRMKHDQAERIGAARKTINKLDKHEKRAFWYAAVLGIRHSTPAAERDALLADLRDKIAAGRTDANIQELKGSVKKSDMLPDLDAMIAHPDAHFTPKLGDVIEELRADSLRAGRDDPSLTSRQRVNRRYAPLAYVLGMHRGEVPAGSEWQYFPGDAEASPIRSTATDTIDGTLAELDSKHGLPGEPKRFLPAVREPDSSSLDSPASQRVGNHQPQGFYEEVPVGARYNPDETDVEFVKRLHAEMVKRGLAKPLYFKSERYVGPTDFASRALGGRRAMRPDFKYRGENLRVGLQDTSPDQFLRGLARNIKRPHNWNHVIQMVDEHVIPGLASPHGTTLSDLRRRIYEKGIDESSIAYWNPGVFRSAAARAAADLPEVQVPSPPPGTGLARPGMHEVALRNRGDDLAPLEHTGEIVRRAISDASLDGRAVVDGGEVPPHLRSTRGWQVVPVEVMREIERQTTPSRALGRGLDVAKSKSSRAILLAGNVPWAAFQVVSNAGVSAAATGGRVLNPANWLGAHSWWKNLSHEERNRIGAEIGLDTTGADSHQVHLGASTNSDVVNTYRAIKAHPFWHSGVAKGHGPSISQLNPLEMMAAFDRKQNNAARVTTLYTLMKTDAVREMGRNMDHASRAQTRLMHILHKPPAEQMRTLADHPHLIERYAEAVHDWLGDYTSLTSFERKTLNRTVMFYPYLRYSLKLVFYTMPMKHPLMTSILAEFGQLRADELKKLLGGDRLYWDTGKVYFGSGGDVTSIDLRRANPALNAWFDAAGTGKAWQGVAGSLPPYAVWIANQLWGRDMWTNQEYRLHGKAAPYGGWKDLDLETRARVFANDFASIFYPYREAGKLSDRLTGVQGDDSLLWSPRPVEFKGRTYVSKLKRHAADEQRNFDHEHTSIVRDLVPILPGASRDFEAAQDQKRIARAEAHPPHRQKKRYFNDGALPTGVR